MWSVHVARALTTGKSYRFTFRISNTSSLSLPNHHYATITVLEPFSLSKLLLSSSHHHTPPSLTEKQVCFILLTPLEDHRLFYWLHLEKCILAYINLINSTNALPWIVFVFYLCLCFSYLRGLIVVLRIPRLKMNFLKRPLIIPLVYELGS